MKVYKGRELKKNQSVSNLYQINKNILLEVP